MTLRPSMASRVRRLEEQIARNCVVGFDLADRLQRARMRARAGQFAPCTPIDIDPLWSWKRRAFAARLNEARARAARYRASRSTADSQSTEAPESMRASESRAAESAAPSASPTGGARL